MSKTRTRLSYDYDRTSLTIRIDPRILKRLRAVGPSVLGGYSRIVNDSVRMCLPFFEYQLELENETDIARFKEVFNDVMQPDCLGESILEACKQIMEQDAKTQGKRKS
jgi:hypothetical protein